MISHGHLRAAIVPVGALPVYHAVYFVFTLLAFSCALQISPPVFMLNQGLMQKAEVTLHHQSHAAFVRSTTWSLLFVHPHLLRNESPHFEHTF